MQDWAAGYVSDIGYTFGYYAELNPYRAKIPLLNHGILAPTFNAACELGFGQGVSVNMHAAAAATSWYGNDFNPSQTNFAQRLSDAAGTNPVLTDESFAEFCSREDLPDFNYIGLHGIWSWVSDENRRILVDFIRRKLAVGGILYVSYNTFPGWSVFAPLRSIMTQHSESLGTSGGGIVPRINGALDFANRLLETSPAYSAQNPTAKQRLESISKQDRHYLAHEYFNKDWQPMYFRDMAEWLSETKLSFVCSAHHVDHIDSANLTADQQKFIAEIQDPILKQSVRDMMVNQQFRRDYWIKGSTRLSKLETIEELKKQSVLLLKPRHEVELKAKSAVGEASLKEEVYGPIVDYLADHQIKSLGGIAEAVKDKNITFNHVVEATLMLIATGQVTHASDATPSAAIKQQVDKLNAFILSKARSNADLAYLASTATAGGIPVSRFDQLFVLGYKEGLKEPSQLAQYVWKYLAIQQQRISKDGKNLETEEENLNELKERGTYFMEQLLPVFKALKIIN